MDGFEKVSDFMDTLSSGWSSGKLNIVFPSWLVRNIQCIPISHFGAVDTLIWPLTKQGTFSVKSCYNAFVGNLGDGSGGLASSSLLRSSKFWKKMWKLDIAPKLKFFVWKIFRSGLPYSAALFSRGMKADALCPICQEDIETVDHIFLTCR